jgi:hypothetical protein
MPIQKLSEMEKKFENLTLGIRIPWCETMKTTQYNITASPIVTDLTLN